MNIHEASNTARNLFTKWVSMQPGYDLERIQASIRQELKWNRERPERCTADCKRETRADAILLGEVRKVLSK